MADEDDSDPSEEECMLTEDDPLDEKDEQLDELTRPTPSEFLRLADVES